MTNTKKISYRIEKANLGETSDKEVLAYKDALETAIKAEYDDFNVSVEITEGCVSKNVTVAGYDGDDAEIVENVEILASVVWDNQ